MSKRFLLTGCSGGGKSTLLQALSEAGYATVPEPGRRIVAEERAGTGAALPWVDPVAFAHRALQMATADLASAGPGVTFFDRGILDASVALNHLTGAPLLTTWPYSTPVFLAPPWPEIYETDADRQHGLDDAVKEYERLRSALNTLTLNVVVLPKTSVEHRTNVVLAQI